MVYLSSQGEVVLLPYVFHKDIFIYEGEGTASRGSSVDLSVALSVEKNMTLNSTIFNTTFGQNRGCLLKVMINSKTFYNYLFSTTWCCLLLLSVAFSVEKSMTLNTDTLTTSIDVIMSVQTVECTVKFYEFIRFKYLSKL